EGSGTQALDTSGYGNTGTLTNGPTWQTTNNCKVGGCLSFDGNNDSVILSSLLIGNSNWTMLVWVKTTSALASILANNDGGPAYNDCGIKDGKIYYQHYDTAWREKFGTNAINNGTWQLLAWTNFSNRTMNMYANGNIENAGFGSVIAGSQGWVNSIGKNWSYYFINGFIDEMRIYNRVLSAAEILAIYNTAR
ncbi:MAG: LamG domain-containing protein, partial [Candidatus Paceibacterota bacterium]